MNKEEGSLKKTSAEPAPQHSDTQPKKVADSQTQTTGTENPPITEMHTRQLHKLRTCISMTSTSKWNSDAWTTTSKF